MFYAFLGKQNSRNIKIAVMDMWMLAVVKIRAWMARLVWVRASWRRDSAFRGAVRQLRAGYVDSGRRPAGARQSA
jgi:hypothetical protein